jgi:DNA polymerase-1
MPKTIAVIDGNSLMHRAYHAVPPTMNAPDGTPTNAVFGFMSMLLKFVDEAHPDAIVCAFDAGRPKFRMEALEQYKAQRPPMDDELRVQFPLMEDLLGALSIPVVKVKGWEGDDILGTISARGDADDFDTLLVTGDKDAYQLVSDHTRVVTTKKGITDVAIYSPEQVEERYGVTPAQFPDFLGLMGDSSDNIPGVPGIGAKTAAKLLQRFGTMEGIYENLDQLKGKQLENIRDNRDAAFISRQVATIVRDLDFDLDLDAIGFPSFEEQAVIDAFGKLRFTSHLSKVLALVGGSPVGEQIDLEWEGYATGPAAIAFAQAAVEQASATDAVSSDACIGVAFDDPQQESLFESGLKVALSTAQGCAVLSGDAAVDVLAQIVRSCPFAVFDGKACLQQVYPADTGCASIVSDDDVFAARLFDASLAAYVLNSSTSSYAPAGLAEAYLGGALPEGKGDPDGLVIQAACMRALVGPLRAALEVDGTAQVYDTIDLPLVAVLACMERVGAPIDVGRLRRMGEDTQLELDALVARIYESAGEEFNIDSPKQVGYILFEVVGLKPRKKTSRGYSTDAKVLKELSDDHELPGLLLKYRELAKIKSTYIDALPKMRGEDGRLHTSFNETVTTTGRLSSSDPNLQNIPVRTDFGRGIRECFVPFGDGEAFVSADYSQIELRLLAHLSGDEHLIAAFESGADFHAATAARVFGIPLEEVTPQLRSRAKAVNFGIVYGQQAFGLGQSLHIGYAEAQEMIDRYFEAYPRVRIYLDETVEQAKQGGFAVTMFGRKRHIPELQAGNGQQRAFGERTAMNHPMQGSAADIIKKAMVEAERRLRAEFPDAKLMLQVHDELDLSVPEDQVAGVSALLADVMQNVVDLKVPLLVDVSSGANWAEAH